MVFQYLLRWDPGSGSSCLIGSRLARTICKKNSQDFFIEWVASVLQTPLADGVDTYAATVIQAKSFVETWAAGRKLTGIEAAFSLLLLQPNGFDSMEKEQLDTLDGAMKELEAYKKGLLFKAVKAAVGSKKETGVTVTTVGMKLRDTLDQSIAAWGADQIFQTDFANVKRSCSRFVPPHIPGRNDFADQLLSSSGFASRWSTAVASLDKIRAGATKTFLEKNANDLSDCQKTLDNLVPLALEGFIARATLFCDLGALEVAFDEFCTQVSREESRKKITSILTSAAKFLFMPKAFTPTRSRVRDRIHVDDSGGTGFGLSNFMQYRTQPPIFPPGADDLRFVVSV